MKSRNILILGFVSLTLFGCALGRSVFDIAPPDAQPVTQRIDKEVLVVSVVDRRVFVTSPRSPNIPSLDPQEEQNTAIKVRAIGRKRDGFGKAHGDFLLAEGQTVETLMTSVIQQAFIEKGYRLVSKEEAHRDTLLVEASVEKFWSWMRPGFAEISLNTEISTDLTLKSPEGDTNKTIYVKSSKGYQTGMEGNWIEVINKALRAYIDELKEKL